MTAKAPPSKAHPDPSGAAHRASQTPTAAKASAKPASAPPAPKVTGKAAAPVKHAAKAPAAPAGAAPAPKAASAAKPIAKPIAKSASAVTPGVVAPPPSAAVPVSKKKQQEVILKAPVEPTTKPARPASSAAKTAAPAPVASPAAAASARPASTTGSPQFTPLGVPVRSGRPSSRLAQLTVPSMAQSVASTAAKSSFTQIAPVQHITPAPNNAVRKDPALANNWKIKPLPDLTDDDVVSMPDSEYMNDTQMAFFRLKLVNLRNGILSNAGETTEHLREDTVVVPDPADRATIEEEHALVLRTRDRERKLLKKIEQSINRIDGGDYGYCDETGEPIGVGRLLARPTATLTLEAQQRRELKQKMFGD